MQKLKAVDEMRLFELVLAGSMVCLPLTAIAEVVFPLSRNAVGPDEVYILEDSEGWKVECVRDEKSEDFCFSTSAISALEHGLKLDFQVSSFVFESKNTNVDVDVVPVASLEITSYSSAEHYNNFSAAITSIDGVPYDGYWCGLTDVSSCLRGPDLVQRGLETLLAGRQAMVTIYDKASTLEKYSIITEINVDLSGLAASFSRAKEFNADIFGIDLASAEIPLEMCDLYSGGSQKRISYTYDEEFDENSTTFRERFRGSKGAGSCPSYVKLAYMTPDLTPAQRKMFCLVMDGEKDSIVGIQQGEQDAYRTCKKPSQSVCERVNNTKETALALTGFASAAVGTAVGTTTVTGTTVVMHSSGAAILTGGAGYISGTLGTIGTAAISFLTLPATVTAAAVSVVAVGGAVYVCSE